LLQTAVANRFRYRNQKRPHLIEHYLDTHNCSTDPRCIALAVKDKPIGHICAQVTKTICLIQGRFRKSRKLHKKRFFESNYAKNVRICLVFIEKILRRHPVAVPRDCDDAASADVLGTLRSTGSPIYVLLYCIFLAFISYSDVYWMDCFEKPFMYAFLFGQLFALMPHP
jgi:hypothetical protein